MDSTQNNLKRQKATPNPNTAQNTIQNPTSQPTLFNEPTSVLDPRASSSPGDGSDPVTGVRTAAGTSSDSPPHLPSEWDPMLLKLLQDDDDDDDDDDDSSLSLNITPSEIVNATLPPFPPSDSFDFSLPPNQIPNDISINPIPTNFSLSQSQLNLLLQAAESVESKNYSLALVILTHLKPEPESAFQNPLQKAVFYFREALESLLLGGVNHINPLSSFETIQKIIAYKDFYDMLPISQFSNFTSNQAILEAVEGFAQVHVIDFDLELGGQWSSFMLEISERYKRARIRPPSVRITAIVGKESMETLLARENLSKFARDHGMRFRIDFVTVDMFETLVFGAIQFLDGEAIVVNLSPAIFRQFSGFFRFLRRISPQITVFVEMECRTRSNLPVSFCRNFAGGIEYYSSLIGCVEAVSDSGMPEKMERIEKFLFRPGILQWVSDAGKEPLPWRELFLNAGMGPIQFSEFTETQALCLVRRAPVPGFHLAKRHASMVLGWQGKDLIATSAWRCC
ncbi:scarecrow-like protein 15 [Tasmannia lanceolata]|uniref:scarecrow-like protein 15 n=1 Tax=Tasmannia lanceolata TaxID=3420 RepID=UPI0040638033